MKLLIFSFTCFMILFTNNAYLRAEKKVIIIDIGGYEDTNGDGILDPGEDKNNNGVLDNYVGPNEDTNNNGILDENEDLNGNKTLDTTEDIYNIGKLTEDTNGNGVLDPGEDINGNGILDVNPDINGNGEFDKEIDIIYHADGILDKEEIHSCNGECQFGKKPDNPYLPEDKNKSKLLYKGTESLANGVISVQTSGSTIDNYLELNVIHQDATTSTDAVLFFVGENRNNVTINNYKYLAFTVDENKDGSSTTGYKTDVDDDGGEFDAVIKVEANNVIINNHNDAYINALDKGAAIKILGNGSHINQDGSNGLIKSVDTAILIDNSATYTPPTTDINLDDMDNEDFSYNHEITLNGFFSTVEGVDGYGIYSLDAESIKIITNAYITIQSTNNHAIMIDGKHNFISITNGSSDSKISTLTNHSAINIYGDNTFDNRVDISNPYKSAQITAGAINEDINGNGTLDPDEDTNGNGTLDIISTGSIGIFSNADEFNLTNSGKITAYESVIKLGEETSHFDIKMLSGSELYLFSDYTGTARAAIDIKGATKGGNINLTSSSSNLTITAEHADDKDSFGNSILIEDTDYVAIDVESSVSYFVTLNGSIVVKNGSNVNITINEGTVINTIKKSSPTGVNTTAIDIENATDSTIHLGGEINGDILLGSNTMFIDNNTYLNGKLYMGTDSRLDINGTFKGAEDAINGSAVGDAEINFTCIATCDFELGIFKDIDNVNFKSNSKVSMFAAKTEDTRINNLNFENKVTLNIYENQNVNNNNNIVTFDTITAKRSTFNLYYTQLNVESSLNLTENSTINVYASGIKNGKLNVSTSVLDSADQTTRVNVKPDTNENSIVTYGTEYNIATILDANLITDTTDPDYSKSVYNYDYLFQSTLVVYDIEYKQNASDVDAILNRKLFEIVLNDSSLFTTNTLLNQNTIKLQEYLDEALIFSGSTQDFQNYIINGIDSQATSTNNVALALNSINPQDLNFIYIPAEQAFSNTVDAIDNHLKYTMLKSLKNRRWLTGNINSASFKDSYNDGQNITTLTATAGYDIIKNVNTRTGIGASVSYSSSSLNFNTTDTVKNNIFTMHGFYYQSYMPNKFYINTYILTSISGYNTKRNALYNRIYGEELTANHFRAGLGNIIEAGYVFGSLKSKYLNLSFFNEALFISGAEYDEGNSHNSINIEYDSQQNNYIGSKAEFVYLGRIIDINSQEYKLSASVKTEIAYNILYDEDLSYDTSFTNDPTFLWATQYYNTKDKLRSKIGADVSISDNSVSITFGYEYTASGDYKANNFNIKAYKAF